MVEFRIISDSLTDGTVLNLPEKSPNFLNYSLSDLVKNSRYRYFSEHNPAFEKNIDIAFGKMRYKNQMFLELMLIGSRIIYRLSVKPDIREARKAECSG